MIPRRDFITLLGSAAAAWPLAARAQQSERIRHVAVLMGAGDDPQGQFWIAGFQQRLAELGWLNGRNVQVDVHWGVQIWTTFAALLRSWRAPSPT